MTAVEFEQDSIKEDRALATKKAQKFFASIGLAVHSREVKLLKLLKTRHLRESL
jgi:hypothetical protein